MVIRLRPNVLYTVRKDLGISRDALARRMRISSSTAWRIESGQNAPGVRVIEALLRLTDMPFESLFVLENGDDDDTEEW